MTVYLVVSTAPYAGMEVHSAHDSDAGAEEEVARIIKERGCGSEEDESVYVLDMEVRSSIALDDEGTTKGEDSDQ